MRCRSVIVVAKVITGMIVRIIRRQHNLPLCIGLMALEIVLGEPSSSVYVGDLILSAPSCTLRLNAAIAAWPSPAAHELRAGRVVLVHARQSVLSSVRST